MIQSSFVIYGFVFDFNIPVHGNVMITAVKLHRSKLYYLYHCKNSL